MHCLVCAKNSQQRDSQGVVWFVPKEQGVGINDTSPFCREQPFFFRTPMT